MKLAKERLQQRYPGLKVRRAGPQHLVVEESRTVVSGLSKIGADALTEEIQSMGYYCVQEQKGSAYILIITKERMNREQREASFR